MNYNEYLGVDPGAILTLIKAGKTIATTAIGKEREYQETRRQLLKMMDDEKAYDLQKETDRIKGETADSILTAEQNRQRNKKILLTTSLVAVGLIGGLYFIQRSK